MPPQNLTGQQDALTDWQRDRLAKMDPKVFKQLQAAAARFTAIGQRPALLSIGEGAGADAQKIYVGHLQAQVTATDATPIMLQFAGTHYSQSDIEFVQDIWPDLAKLGARKFDIIISNRVLQEIPPQDQINAINRTISMVRPGGLIVIVYQFKITKEGQHAVDEDAITRNFQNLNAQRAAPYKFQIWKSEGKEPTPALDGSEREEHILSVSAPLERKRLPGKPGEERLRRP